MATILMRDDARRGLLVAAGALLGLMLALATAGLSWEAGAAGLGLALAALVGLAQTCSA
jgi:hypothetical protein